MDGHEIMTMDKAAPLGDFFITATGCKDTITMAHIMTMKNRAILSNAGHFNVEIDMAGLEKQAVQKRESRKNIMGYQLSNEKWVNVIGDGRLVNIAAGDGHPAEIMDMSFAVQIMSALYIKDNYKELGNKVVDVSDSIDNAISKRLLAAWGAEIDELTPAQEKYLNSWEV